MANELDVLDSLAQTIHERRSADPMQSYVAKLLHGHQDQLLKKIGEEATEVVLAAKGRERGELIHESADLLFHLLVVFEREGIALSDICVELASRFALSGLEEKAQRTK